MSTPTSLVNEEGNKVLAMLFKSSFTEKQLYRSVIDIQQAARV